MSKSKDQTNPLNAGQKLRNFCSSYQLMEADEMLARLFTVLIAGNYSVQSDRTKERLLDYFEALEEVLPVLYELQDVLNKPQNQEGEEKTYQDEVSSQNIFASFKRHPE